MRIVETEAKSLIQKSKIPSIAYVPYQEGALRQKKVKAFRDWLFSEFATGR